jgi:ADP-ribosylglycohydrolase
MLSRFVGTVIGQAVGDALGFPFEGLPPQITALAMADRPSAYRPHASGAFPLGQYTDDTQMMRAILESIVEQGRVDPKAISERFVELWTTTAIVGQGSSCRDAVMRMVHGVPWDQAGVEPPRAGNGSAMRTAPIGLMWWRDPDSLVRDAEVVSQITHRDPRCLAGAAAVSAGVAFNVAAEPDTFEAEAFLHRVSEAARHSSLELVYALERLPDWLDRGPDPDVLDEIRASGRRHTEQEPDAATPWHGVSPFVVPTVALSLYAFLSNPRDFVATLQTAIAAGGDVDTTAAIAGALSGALNGVEAIPPPLARAVNDRGQFGYDYLSGLASKLHDLAGG